MADTDDLARRYLTLWADYLIAAFAEAAAAVVPVVARGERSAAPVGPGPDEGGHGEPRDAAGPPVGAAPAAGPPGERDDAVVELARRIAVLEERLARLERGRAVARPRGRDRRARA